MKRLTGLYERVISLDNLRAADEEARRGKRYSYGVRLHDRRREANLKALHEALRRHDYHTSRYEVFTIREPKERQIYRLPYYPDRIVHHAIMRVVGPVWTSVLTHNTFSCIKGRGIEGCARHVQRIIDAHAEAPRLYCLKIDLRKFYPSVRHDVLKDIVRRKIKDKELLGLLDEIIDSAEGLPIGNYLSQYLANLLLAYFMHEANERERVPCAEYADDIVFFATDKGRLHALLHEFVRPRMAALGLTVKSNYQVFPIADNRQDRHGRALDYVGYRFYRRQRLMRKRIKQRFARRLAALRKQGAGAAEMRRGAAPWLGWAKHSNSTHLLKTLFQDEYESILKRKTTDAGARGQRQLSV